MEALPLGGPGALHTLKESDQMEDRQLMGLCSSETPGKSGDLKDSWSRALTSVVPKPGASLDVERIKTVRGSISQNDEPIRNRGNAELCIPGL